MSALASMAGFGPISFAKTEIVWIKLQFKISVNNKIELINTHKNNFECFYDYCNSELKAKIDNEKLLKKEYEKTENWLKKNNLTEKEFNIIYNRNFAICRHIIVVNL